MSMIWKEKKHDKSNFNRLKMTPKYEKNIWEIISNDKTSPNIYEYSNISQSILDNDYRFPS